MNVNLYYVGLAICCSYYESCFVYRGSLIGHPVENIRGALTDGASHAVDSSELAFKLAAIYAFRKVLLTSQIKSGISYLMNLQFELLSLLSFFFVLGMGSILAVEVFLSCMFGSGVGCIFISSL